VDHKKLNRQLTIGIVGGIAVGLVFALTSIPPALFGINFVEICRLAGNIFIWLLKMVAVPLVFFSIFTGVTSLGDIAHLGRLGRRTVVFFLSTSFIAAVIGLILVNTINPGAGLVATGGVLPEGLDAMKDVGVIEMLTGQLKAFLINPFEALAKGTSAMVAIIVASILFGVGILKATHEKKQLVIDFMNTLTDAAMHITVLVIRLAPVGVFGILVRVLYDKREHLEALGQSLGLFVLTCTIGLALHGLVVLPLVLRTFSTMPVKKFFKGIAEVMKVAFGTDSSLATMPVTLECLQTNLKVSKRTSDFIVPLGATVNMNGSTLYEAVCAIFIAQALGMDLSLFQQVVVFFTATIAAIGAAGIPSAGLVTLVIVLNAIGIPYDLAFPYIGMIFTVDRFVDMCRTMVNVEGDCVASVVIDEMEQKDARAEAA
jgi:Na+/H+-dicarboxylate symporter